MSTQPITVLEFTGEDLNYQFNDDLNTERCKGENLSIGGGRMPTSRSRARGQQLCADTIEAAIESLMVGAGCSAHKLAATT